MDFEGAFFDTTKFEPISKLGEGKSGKVYLVKNNEDDSSYAAKIINPNGNFGGRDQLMFLREAQILHKLRHPAIVKFYGINFHSFIESDKLEPTILTEYVSNGSLKDIFDKADSGNADHNWTATKKYICLLGISDAMRYLHEQGVIHRDLKPQNILIDDNFFPRVSDFGLSRCFSQSLSTSMKIQMTGNIGTPLYMAPELMANEDQYGPAVDIYAFSLIAYEIIAGIEPFSEKGKPASFSILSKVLSGYRPKLPNFIPEKMKQLIEKCWSQDPKDRPSFEEIFKQLSSDFSYFDEDIDEDEINDYLEILEEARKTEAKEAQNSKIEAPVQSNPSPITPKLRKSENIHIKSFSNYLIDMSTLTIEEKKISTNPFSATRKAVIKNSKTGHKKDCAVCLYDISDYHFKELDNQERFLRHVKCHSSLEHETIIPFIGFAYPTKTQNTCAIITELMPNGSLNRLIEVVNCGNCPDNWETIKYINIFGIAAGMAYIHQHDYIHRDLKPSHILLDENYHPKISGFDQSKPFKQGTENYISQTLNFGTPLYLAPEIILDDDSHYSNKIDVYSYAMVLYELVTYNKPYYEKEDIRILDLCKLVSKGRRPTIQHSSEFPDEYVELIERCWDSNPDNRPSFIQIVKDFMDNREKYFSSCLIDEDELFDYIDLVTKDLDFSSIE